MSGPGRGDRARRFALGRGPEVDAEEQAVDPLQIRFRLDSIPAGIWISVCLAVAISVYVLSGSGHGHRAALLAICIVTVVANVAALRLPWLRVVRSSRREVVFVGWSLTTIVVIALAATLDGGVGSPIVAFLFIPIVFCGISYPRLPVIIVSATATATYVALAIADAQAFGPTAVFAVALAATSVMSVWTTRNHDRRREALVVASRTDPLTGCLNRRGFEDAAAAAFASVSRFDRPSTLLMIDLNDFKRYNDTHGHVAGDELLCWVVSTITQALRPNDTIARLGGDEFAVLLAGADRAAGRRFALRLDELLGGRASHSTGLATTPQDGVDVDSLYRCADAELYERKRSIHRELFARSAS